VNGFRFGRRVFERKKSAATGNRAMGQIGFGD